MNQTSWPIHYSFPHLLDFVQDIVNGKRPEVQYERGGSDPFSCLIDQMATMFRNGNIVDYPGMYAVMENYGKVRVATGRGEEDFLSQITPDTSRQSISLKGITAATDFHRWLKERSYEDRVSVSGFSWDQRGPDAGALRREAEVRDAHVILPGGLYALRGALELIQQAVEGRNPPGPVYLVNPRVSQIKDYRFWDGLHDALEHVLQMPERDRSMNGRDWTALTQRLESFGVHVVDSVAQCQERLTAQLGAPKALRPVAKDDVPTFVPPRYQIPRGSTIFFATTSPDKLVELRKMMAPYDVRVARLDMLTPCNSPLEKSGTYTGNCGEKMREAIHAVREMQQQHPFKYQRALREMKVDPQKAFILVEDAGVHTSDRRVADEFPLDGMEKGTALHAGQFIGQEFGPATIGALGEKQFFENLNRAFDAAEAKARQTGGDPVRRTMVQTSVFGLAPLEQPKQKDACDFQIFSGTGTVDVLPAPRPADVTVLHTGHYLAPRCKGVPQRSQAEWDADGDRYTLTMSARSKAVEGLAIACRVPVREKQQALSSEPFRLSLYGDSAPVSGELTQAGYAIDMPPQGRASLGASIEATLEHSDATLLMPCTPQTREEGFVERLFTLFSHIVARQIHPRDRDKPLIVLNPQDGPLRGCWDGPLAYFDELREIGMIKDQNRTLLQEVGTLAAARKMLDLSRQNLMRTPPEEESSIVIDETTLKKSGKFNVAVFCSATNKNQHLLDLADRTGMGLAMRDFGIVYGAGDRSMMGAVLGGALNVEETVKAMGRSLFIAGSSTDPILKAEATDVEGMKQAIAAHGQYFHAKDIYQRMEYMIKQSDAFVILPGGAGTIQELAALMMLKQGGHPDMRGKDIVVVDYPYAKASAASRTDDRGFYTGLLEQISSQQREALGIHVVKSEKEALERVEELRHRRLTAGWAERAAAHGRAMRDHGGGWAGVVQSGAGVVPFLH
jgi:predicted Rossmann-fold nucleotide-binding protein